MTAQVGVWAPLPPTAYLHRRVAPSFPLDQTEVRLFSRARHGLVVGVRALGLRSGDEILVPAYHHGSEVEALLRMGLVPRFYEATDTLEPDEAELDRLRGPATRGLYLIHYLGFPQDGRRWRRFCDERGLLLFEDAAQAWLASSDGSPVGSFGDLAIFCLYKTFGLPDGAALLTRGVEAPAPLRGRRLRVAAVAARHAVWLGERSAIVGSLAQRLTRNGEYRPEEDFALDGLAPAASSTSFLLPRLGADAAGRRRAHYRLLLDELAAHVPAPFNCLAPGASPFAFPVMSKHKGELIEGLARAGVQALDVWSVPHPALPAERFPAAAARRATTVGLPVHQELRAADVDRVARAALRPRPRRAPSLAWVEDIDVLRDLWRSLAAAAGNVFATWEWASVWWRQYGAGRHLRIAVCRRGSGEPFALLPLYVWRDRPLRVIRFLGHGTADELGPVCAPGQRPTTARALRQAVGELRADILFAEHLLGAEAWSALLDGHIVQRDGFPLIRSTGGWEAYLASRSPHLRKKMAWQERKLARARGLEYRLADDPARLRSDLDTLFALHRARWPDGTEFTEHERFHRAFAACALERGWLRLWFLVLEGTPAAAWYGFRFGETEFHFQSGRAPVAERDSVGTILLAHTIREAFADGISEYRLLRGGEQYKQRFATADPGIETLVVAGTPAGRTAITAGRAATSWHPLRSAVGAALSRSRSASPTPAAVGRPTAHRRPAGTPPSSRMPG
jgi:dTDP-4-amino-4,6-dideoxygalactose transaminase/CelD/BcsL family acetyltransferase involved in cellulose biosynthesis